MIYKLDAEIIENSVRQTAAGARYGLLKLSCPTIANEASPGQFLQVRVASATSTLLRRPFSLHNACDGIVEILYKVVGKGTELLSCGSAGELLNLLGPLGKGFDISTKQHAVLVAGGIGIAPLFHLGRALADAGKELTLLVGAATGEELLAIDRFTPFCSKLKTVTEDGSICDKGIVTDLVEESLSNKQECTLYGCGPIGMLRELASIASRLGVNCQVSLEARMACGTGVCRGCVVQTRDGYKRVCTEGPVFDITNFVGIW